MGYLTLLGAGAGGAAITLLFDTFTDANGTALPAHTMDVGGTWSVDVAGTYTVQGNRANFVNSTGGNLAWADAGQADVTLTAVVNISSAYGGVVLRFSDANNYWLVFLDNPDGAFQLYEKNAGSFTQRASLNTTISTNTDHTLSVTAGAATITATLDGASQISYGSATDNQTATKCGLYDQGSSGCQWDNFKVTHP
jgi:hypothetical protein